MKKLLFVYNPHAGKAKLKPALSGVIDTFDRAGYETVVRPTRAKGDAETILFDRAGDFDRVAVSGGDGTMNEALRGLLRRADAGLRVPDLGYIPAGSTNDFARSVGIPTQPIRAAQVAAGDTKFRCDACSFNGTPFVYVAAFGAFTEVTYETPQKTKNLLGHFAYVLAGINSLGKIRGIRITAQTYRRTVAGEYLFGMVSNSTSVGGFDTLYDNRNVSLNDGLAEVVLVKNPKTLAEKNELVSALLQMNLDSPLITYLKTPSVRLRATEPISWTLDGEFGGETDDAQIRILPRAYTVLTAAEPKTDRPAQTEIPHGTSALSDTSSNAQPSLQSETLFEQNR